MEGGGADGGSSEREAYQGCEVTTSEEVCG
jgi:hypothetical protein